MNSSSDIWIQQAQKGDHYAFNQLVQEWYGRIYNFSWKYFANQQSGEHQADLAAEISQKTFIKVFEKNRRARGFGQIQILVVSNSQQLLPGRGPKAEAKQNLTHWQLGGLGSAAKWKACILSRDELPGPGYDRLGIAGHSIPQDKSTCHFADERIRRLYFQRDCRKS